MRPTPTTYIPANRIGDAHDPTLGLSQDKPDNSETNFPQNQLMTSSPEQIAGIAQKGNFPQVFESTALSAP